MSSAGVEKRGSASTVRACDLCRKRKRRCLWTSGTEGCTSCVNLKETCTTTHVRKERAKPQRGNLIFEYESRIKRLESLLQEQKAAQPHIRQRLRLQDTEPSVPVSTWVENLRHEVEMRLLPSASNFDPFDLDPTAEANDAAFSGDLESLFINEADQAHPESGLARQFSLDNMQPSADFHEDAAFLQSADFEPEVIEAINIPPPPLPSPSVSDWYLPSPELGTSLLAEFLTDMNTAYPLYQPHVIAEHLRFCYAGQSDGTSVSWISAYSVFGLAHTLRAMSTAGTIHDTEMAKYYLARAYLSLNGLLSSPQSLGQVQCLLGVAMLMMTSPCSYNGSGGHFVSTALRVIRSLACKDDGDATVTPRDLEQERRVFWIAFINDSSLSILHNKPTTHQLEDVAYCSDFVADELGAVTAAEGNWRVPIFYLHTRLALLQAEAIDQVLSLKARNTMPLDIAAATTIILARLQAYHEHELFQLSADQLFQLLYRSDITHTVTLEARYFATVYRLHAFMAFDMDSRINPFKLASLDRISGVKQHKAYSAARRLVSLLAIAPRGNVGLYWLIIPIITAALVTVFAHHINNPSEEALTPNEIREYNQILADNEAMVHYSGIAELAQTRNFCISLFSKLTGVVERNHQPHHSLSSSYQIGSPNLSRR
ncbi:hypothetical protein EJ02DRAFT_344824 [Clathrospora elynae]|uniref:Zn(2)-C6 fungal-type domain-containing protein n=1 Tax=Clathrospora elynae TaxID=706981 RepID=A0A6A5SSP8_9PLEO|nr:hypothetical protein EJ02DRAFT_344824 [Clathrospora elynae]